MAEVSLHRRGRWLAFGLCVLGLGTLRPGLAAIDEGDAPVGMEESGEHAMGIQRIMVAPSGAWITRGLDGEVIASMAGGAAEVEGLQLAGADGRQPRLWVLGLPADMDTGSLRVSGNRVDETKGLRTEREEVTETPRFRRLQARLADAEAEAREIRVLLEENALRRDIARDQLAGLSRDAADLDATWADDGPVAGLMNRLTDARRALLDRRARNDETLRELREQLDQMRAAEPGWKVGIPLADAADDATDGAPAIRLDYRVARAGWEPVYQARLDTGERRVDWRMAAQVHQQTGEDWPAASMTLVTSDHRRFYPVPALPPLTIGFVDPEGARPPEPRAMMAPSLLSDSAAEAATATDETGFASQIAINRPSRVPSGPGGVRLEVFDQGLDADIELRVAPQQSRDAVLVGRFEPSIAHPLPAGRWEVHRDGQQQAGRSRAGLGPDEEVELSFGVDPRVVVELERPPDQRAGHGLIGKFNQVERRRQVAVTSRHEQPVPVTVLMRLPTALDADIVVEPLGEMTSPARKDHDGQSGVWAYERELVPDQPWQIDFAYRVRWPEGKAVSPF
ncbi:MAG: mucoidy inhibitor MuiA family protein [Guyparkeria sp.]|uniref:mucoidy inhibitor MuiA family protein n=1 Tax=Guyparkeria sp. TaxID=2035736 RepID=UPI00397A2784